MHDCAILFHDRGPRLVVISLRNIVTSSQVSVSSTPWHGSVRSRTMFCENSRMYRRMSFRKFDRNSTLIDVYTPGRMALFSTGLEKVKIKINTRLCYTDPAQRPYIRRTGTFYHRCYFVGINYIESVTHFNQQIFLFRKLCWIGKRPFRGLKDLDEDVGICGRKFAKWSRQGKLKVKCIFLINYFFMVKFNSWIFKKIYI